MPARPFVADVFRVAVTTTRASRQQVNIFHVKGVLRSGFFGYAQTDADSVASGFFSTFASRFLPQLTSDTSMVQVEAIDLTNAFGVVGVHSGSGAGGLGGAPLPANVAICVSWHEALHYRGGHPRSYMGGVSDTFIADPRNLTTSFAGTMNSAASSFLTDVNAFSSVAASSYFLCGVHYSLAKVAQVPPLVVAISASSVNTRLDSQRRRLGK